MIITFLQLLTLLFIGLKLLDVVTWSWWLVLMPTLAPFSLGMSLILIGSAMVHWARLR